MSEFDHEAKVMNHCLQHGITVQTLPGGATRFLGNGVNLLVRDIANVTLANLRAYSPRKPLAVRADWDLHCVEKDKVDTPATSLG